jgi:hypothetical protein
MSETRLDAWGRGAERYATWTRALNLDGQQPYEGFWEEAARDLQCHLDLTAAELERVAADLRAHEIAMRQIRKERQTGYLLQRLDAILSEFDAALADVARAAQENT